MSARIQNTRFIHTRCHNTQLQVGQNPAQAQQGPVCEAILEKHVQNVHEFVQQMSVERPRENNARAPAMAKV